MQFLSMKLVAVNPRLGFNIDELFAKEVISMQLVLMEHHNNELGLWPRIKFVLYQSHLTVVIRNISDVTAI